MRRRSGLLGVPMILGCVLLVVGCGPPALENSHSGSEPSPVARTPEAPDSRTALGDPRTFDPCTLTDPALVERFGAVTETDTVSLDYCLLRVRLADGALAQLAVGELGSGDSASAAGSPVQRQGEFRVVQDAPLPGHCTRRILFGDGVAMGVSADLLSGPPGARLCGLAEAGAKGAVEAIEREEVGHRRYPENSWAKVDPCEVLDTAVVREVPGMESARAVPAPSGHQCSWGKQLAQEPRVRLVHTAGDPPRVSHGAAVEERIAGRTTVLSMVGGDPSSPVCSAETGHIPFGQPGAGQVEVAMLVVSIPGENGIAACEFARGLAQSAWPALPAA
ncbi:DUF3558 domain-containing protein [Parasphingorhabdus pacifica]